MNVIKYLKILFILISSFQSSKSDDYCALPERFIQQVKCKGYSCGNKFCSAVKKICEPLNFWSYLSSINIVSYDKAHSKYKKYLKSIKPCLSDHYVLINPESLCLKQNLCYERKNNTSSIKIKLKKSYKCKAKHEYSCDDKYCATNKHACILVFANQNLLKKINACK